MIREFTPLDFAQLAEKLIRRLKQMYKHRYRPSRDPAKGYQGTYADYYDYTCDVANGGMSIHVCLQISLFCL